MAELTPLVASGDEVTVVFDGRPPDDLGGGGIVVRGAGRRGRDAGDDTIVGLVGGDATPGQLVVVTSARGLAGRVRALGATVEGAGAFLRRLPGKAPGVPSRVRRRHEGAGMAGDAGPEAGAKGIVEDIKGKAKDVVGNLTGNDDLEREGEAQQAKADAQRDVAAKEAEADKARAEAKAQEAQQRANQ
ncbi:hypothetical protein BH18ACT1_BH18ACT1_00700 [soil metagenome]